MNFKKFTIALASITGVTIVSVFVLAGILILQKSLIPSIAQANPACAVNDDLTVTGQLQVSNIVGRTDWLTLMPATSSQYVQVGYGGTPRDLHVWGNTYAESNLTVGGKYAVVSGADNVIIQRGLVNKTSGIGITITFPQAFSAQPTVVVTPYWFNRAAAVGSVETLNLISNINFSVYSNNAGADYWIEWIAIGPK
jgi:hypothetical protein